jgi:hypothetical protein
MRGSALLEYTAWVELVEVLLAAVGTALLLVARVRAGVYDTTGVSCPSSGRGKCNRTPPGGAAFSSLGRLRSIWRAGGSCPAVPACPVLSGAVSVCFHDDTRACAPVKLL